MSHPKHSLLSICRSRRLQQGVVLVTSLIFMVVLTLIAVIASQSTVLEARMSHNVVIKSRATESSEYLRLGANQLIPDHLYYRGWPTALQKTSGGNAGSLTAGTFLFSVAAGLTLDNTDYWGDDPGASENLYDQSTWKQSMTLEIDGNNSGAGDGDFNDDVDQEAHLYVHLTTRENASGSATAMVGGYEGIGKSSASGGAYIFFDTRSVGYSADNSSSVTGSNYLYVIQN